MSETWPRLHQGCLAILLAISIQACGPIAASATPTPGISPGPLASATALAPTLTQPPATTTPDAAASSPAATDARVLVTAKNGNVFIRRGPDLGFNPIGTLMNGQSVTALARDVLAEWLEVPLSAQADQTGWISIQTSYTVVTGDLQALPEVEPTYYPVPASLRNCTHHQMLITPGDIILPPLDSFPANDVQMNPGTYVVIDTDLDTYPQVLKVELREGSEVDVRVDGSGEKHKCPVP